MIVLCEEQGTIY